MQDHDDEHGSDHPDNPGRRRIFQAAAAAGIGSALPGMAAAAPSPKASRSLDAKLREQVKNVVVIYLENRSFNNLFAGFAGLAQPMPAQAPQRDRDGSVLPALPKM